MTTANGHGETSIVNIKKASKLESFGVFRNYSWPASLEAFNKYNLIYGWNRSGKTTFSRMLAACEKQSTEFEQYPAGGSFQLVAGSGAQIKSDDLSNCPLNVRVFNKDFVNDNISFDTSAVCSPIVQVSAEDIETEKQLKTAEQEAEGLEKGVETAKKEREVAERAQDQFLISTALSIKQMVGNLKAQNRYYAYDKSQLRRALESRGIDDFQRLSDKEADACKTLLSSTAKPKLVPVPAYQISTDVAGVSVRGLVDTATAFNGLIKRQVVSETIERLKDDQALNTWVAHGLELHRHKESGQCLFCQKPLDSDCLDRLSRHFSADYEELQESLRVSIEGLDALRLDHVVVPSDLDRVLTDEYQSQVDAAADIVTQLNAWTDEARARLSEKLDNPLASFDPISVPEKLDDRYNDVVKELNGLVDRHNERVDNHQKHVLAAEDQLADHITATALVEQDYRKIVAEVETTGRGEAEAGRLLEERRKEISDLRKRTSSIGGAVNQVNKHLEEFFGRKEIQLEMDQSGLSYVIQRDGEAACNLSEGEKTAIAFSYFLVKVMETGFKKKEGVIVIDDPISSLDSNFVFHCFSLIKNNFGDAGQLFVLTHNFELFNLVKSWLCTKEDKRRRQGRPGECGFYMIENGVENGMRYAELCALESTLLRFRSEYHYLFAKLSEFVVDDHPRYDDLYTISNIARRFLEIFASFMIPTTGDLASKLGVLVKDGPIDSVQKDKVYKLINEYSHGPDPTSAIEHKDKIEAQEAVRIAMQIVEQADSRHYELLTKSCALSYSIRI